MRHLSIFILVIGYCYGFTWHVDHQEIGSDSIVKLSEQYMYGAHSGPLQWLIPGGSAHIESDIYLEAL